MPYSTKKQVQRINLPSDPDYWVEVATKIKWREYKKIIEAQSRKDLSVGDVYLTSLITDWNLDNEAGEILDVTGENVDELERIDAEKILEVLSANIEPESDDQKKSSSKKSIAPSQEEGSPPQS